MSTKRRSMRGKDGKFGKHSIRRHSIRRHSVVSFEGQEDGDDEDFMQIYKEEEEVSSEEEIFENIKLQKEIVETMRCQPWKIRKKLQVLRLAKDYVEKHEGRLSRSHGYQEKGAKAIRRIKREFLNFIALFIPWEMRIKKIESHYGSVVASYFVFLRWLVWTNIWLAILPIAFVIVPEIIAGKPYGSADRKTIPDHAQAAAYNLKTVWDAEGVVKYSMLFIGYYGNEERIGTGYRLPLAYFLTGIGSFAFSFIMVLRQMASNSRMSRLSSKDEQFTFAWKLYTSWDYMIGNPETSNQKFASIATTFRESILEEKEKTKKENKKLIIFLRVIANILVCISLALSTWAIQVCVARSRENDIKKRRGEHVPTFWEENEVTVIMTSITTLFPSLFDLIALMEKYHPRVNLRWQLGRIFVLNLLSIYTLFIALFWKQQDLTKEIELQLSNSTYLKLVNVTYSCPLDIMSTMGTMVTDAGLHLANNSVYSGFLPDSIFGNTTNSPLGNCSRLELQNVTKEIDSELCWESIIGQEVVKLTILDVVFTAGNVIIVDFLRGLCVRYTNICCCWDLEKQFPEYGEFKTAENILHLINNQGMIWLGTFFCPGLPVMNLLKLLMLLYMRNWAVMVCNVPQDRIFRASRSNNFYFAMLLVMLFLCTLPVAYAMVLMKPSPNCGPFSGLNYMMDVITNTMDRELSSEVNAVLGYVASPAVIIPLFLLLSLGIYYLIALSRALREANNDLKMQLEYERTDGRKKVYAMAAIREGETGGEDGATNHRKLGEGGGKGGKSGKRMAGAVASVLAATRMARMISTSNTPPVAVVRGKPSYPRRVPPDVAPRPRRPLPGTRPNSRPTMQSITSQLLNTVDGNSPTEPRARKNLRNLATRARESSRNDAETPLGHHARRVISRTDSNGGRGRSETTDSRKGNPPRQTNTRQLKQQQQQQEAMDEQPRRRRPREDSRGRRVRQDFVDDDGEDELSRYASEDEQQRQSLLGIGRSEDSGVNLEGEEEETSPPQSGSNQRFRRYLSVEGETDEDDEDSEDETDDEGGETNVTFVDETENGGESHQESHQSSRNVRGRQRQPETGTMMSDLSYHTNAVYEEDLGSDEELDEDGEGTLSASGHLIPRIKVTDFSDISSSSDVVIDISPTRDDGGERQTSELSIAPSEGQSGNPTKRGNWRQRQRIPSASPGDEQDPTQDDEGSHSKPSSKIGIFKAVAKFQKAGRDKKKGDRIPHV